jgi:hypothetical protein
MPIPWADIIKLIIQIGLPATQWIIAKAREGGIPTDADWKQLNEMAANSPRKMALEVIEDLGLSLDDPKVISVLTKVG